MTILTTASIWVFGFLFVVIPTVLAMAGPYFVRRRVSLEALSSNNEVAGFKFAVVGVLYAVLLAFAVIVVWEGFSDAENKVAEEAGAIATIYRLSHGLDDATGSELRTRLTEYVNVAITYDWTAMLSGKGSRETTEALNYLYSDVLKFAPSDGRDEQILYEVLYQLDQVTQARRARLVAATGLVPDVLWVVLFGGAFLTTGFTFFFGTENIRAQSLMTGILTLMVFAVLLVVIAIDHPFAGSVRVTPEALVAVLDDLGGG